MTRTANAENLRQYENRFSLIVDQVIKFDSSPNMVRVVKNLTSNFKQITRFTFCVIIILIRIITLHVLIRKFKGQTFLFELTNVRINQN